jgi:hypothetical protein
VRSGMTLASASEGASHKPRQNPLGANSAGAVETRFLLPRLQKMLQRAAAKVGILQRAPLRAMLSRALGTGMPLKPQDGRAGSTQCQPRRATDTQLQLRVPGAAPRKVVGVQKPAVGA